MASPSTTNLEKASEQAGRAAGYGEQATEAAREYASEAVDRVSALAKEAMDDPQRFIREKQTDLAKYTRDNPLQALSIAAGIAFVVGALWKK